MKVFQTFLFLLRLETVVSGWNNSALQILIISSRETLVKSESTSTDAIKQFEL